ncbi:oligoendopeptidase F [Bacillus sp. HMF5848]|uniref:oligoendopeptidase F n=1 Tax=Bacillus sp. HMF5848 TaxID=2495421 RepID=UPI000F78795E|nr:oligoendopeptidase F [Bacillus sp. HMF5848]RSK29064.1 oligoendopeptidase F [Bacillus sp. HMF5848]
MSKRLTRQEVPTELTWKLEDLFMSDEAWETELTAIQQDIATVTKYKGTFGEGPQQLLQCLVARDEVAERMIRAYTYANLQNSGDGTDPTYQGNVSQAASMYATISAKLSFIESEILALPDGTVEGYIEAEPGLKQFSKTLKDILANKPYTLTPETEEVLAALGEVHGAPYVIYNRSKLSDMQFDSFKDGKGEVLSNSFALYEDRYEISEDTTVRRNAYESFIKTLQQYKNTFAATYATEVKKQVTLSRLRNYESVTHMLLHPQQVTQDMYNNQLDVIFNELAPFMRRFADLKKRVLGLETLKFCDLKAPLDPEFNPKTTYEEASEVILEALKVMGPEYSAIMEKGLSERWVDLADNVGKATGAFCASPYGAHPYILITWTDSMRGAFILAHELGHAGHFYLANKHQRVSNTRPSTYFVEAPSTMNELILGHHILNKTNDARMKRWVLLQFIGTYYHNFVTHLLEGEFQRRVYEAAENGKALTATSLSAMKAAVLKEFWGDSVEIDEGASLTWMRQPHYYMGLYPYTYSAGLTASTAVHQMMLEEGQPVVDRWLEVLKAGGTLKPLELMSKAGVDMSEPDAIRKAVTYVGSLIEDLEKSFA